MTTPKIVLSWPEADWISIDDQIWLSGNVRDPTVGPAAVVAVHLAKGTDEQCKQSPRGIGLHTIVSRDPLTITASLVCEVCGWHGWVTDGHWVPA